MLHRGMKFKPLVFMMSYLCYLPARDPSISDDDHLKHENNFLCKKVQIQNFD